MPYDKKEWPTLSLVFVSHKTSSCWIRNDMRPTMLCKGHVMQWRPGSSSSLNWPRSSTTPTSWVRTHTRQQHSSAMMDDCSSYTSNWWRWVKVDRRYCRTRINNNLCDRWLSNSKIKSTAILHLLTHEGRDCKNESCCAEWIQFRPRTERQPLLDIRQQLGTQHE